MLITSFHTGHVWSRLQTFQLNTVPGFLFPGSMQFFMRRFVLLAFPHTTLGLYNVPCYKTTSLPYSFIGCRGFFPSPRLFFSWSLTQPFLGFSIVQPFLHPSALFVWVLPAYTLHPIGCGLAFRPLPPTPQVFPPPPFHLIKYNK